MKLITFLCKQLKNKVNRGCDVETYSHMISEPNYSEKYQWTNKPLGTGLGG